MSPDLSVLALDVDVRVGARGPARLGHANDVGVVTGEVDGRVGGGGGGSGGRQPNLGGGSEARALGGRHLLRLLLRLHHLASLVLVVGAAALVRALVLVVGALVRALVLVGVFLGLFLAGLGHLQQGDDDDEEVEGEGGLDHGVVGETSERFRPEPEVWR